MKEEKKILLIHKVITGVATSEEQRLFDDLHAQGGDNIKLIDDISYLWEKSKKDKNAFDKNKAKARLFDQIGAEEMQKNESPVKVRTLSIRKLMAVAAVLLFLVAAIFVFEHNNNGLTNRESDVVSNFEILPGSGNETGAVKMYKLSDLTKIWADANAKISAIQNETDGNRLVKLEGDAFFEVSKDKAHPFVVEVKEHKVRVVGTSFQIFSGDSGVEVDVYSGVVEFSNQNNDKILLRKGEGAISDSSEKTFVKISKEDFKTNTKESYLIFNNSNLSSVLSKLSKYFGVEFIYDCKTIDDLGGFTSPRFAGDNIEYYFSTIEKLYDLTFQKIDNDKYKVTCD